MKTEKASYRFGWVDWLLLFLVGSVIFAGVYYWRTSQNREETLQPITYTLMVSNLDATLGERGWDGVIPIGSTVLNQNGTMELGRVVSVQARPAIQAVAERQAVQFVEVPNRVELVITVFANASFQAGDGFRVRDIRIAAGKHGDFRIGGLFAANASVISVE